MFDVTRTQLGLPATRATSRPLADVAGLTVHHSTGATLGQQVGQDVDAVRRWVRNLYAFHTNTRLPAHDGLPAVKPWKGARPWADLGYHLLVHVPTRTVIQGRPLGRVGAHAPAVNRTQLGLCVLGGNPNLSDADAAWLADVIDRVRHEVGRPAAWRVDGHRDHSATSCPGDALYGRVRAGLSAPAPSPSPKPPAPARREPGTVAGPSVSPAPFPLARGSYLGHRYASSPRQVRRGTHVRTAQQQLRDRGWRLDVDGVYGPQTERVVRAFQAEKRLTVDGLVGVGTWRALWTEAVT